MKLSLITPVYKRAKPLERYLERLSDQTNKNFEVILVVDTNTDNVLEVIDNAPKSLKKKIRIVYNSKRSSRTDAIVLGVQKAVGEYSLISYVENGFDDEMVNSIINIAKNKKADIIEFKAKFSSPIRFSGDIRKQFNKTVNLEENSDVSAFTYPFDFNKVYRTSVLLEASKYKLPVRVNSRFSIDLVYIPLLVAKTYSTANKAIISSKSKELKGFNPMQMIRQWESLNKLSKDYFNLESISRYEYAQYFTEVVFMSAIAKTTKNKVLISKFENKLKKQMQTTFETILESNKYAQLNQKEKGLLYKFSTPSLLPKIYKELGK